MYDYQIKGWHFEYDLIVTSDLEDVNAAIKF